MVVVAVLLTVFSLRLEKQKVKGHTWITIAFALVVGSIAWYILSPEMRQEINKLLPASPLSR